MIKEVDREAKSKPGIELSKLPNIATIIIKIAGAFEDPTIIVSI
jgi:hypothetical protein